MDVICIYCSSYGEGIFLVLQTTSIAFLVLLYGRSLISAMTFLGIYVAVMAYLFSPAVPLAFLAFLQSVNIGIIILSKVSDFPERGWGVNSFRSANCHFHK